MKMKQLILATLLSGGLVTQAAVLEQWDMGDSNYQNSDQGTTLPNFNTGVGNSAANTPSAGLFTFAPTDASAYSARNSLANNIDLTAGVVKLTLTPSSFDWTTAPGSNSKTSIRLWDPAKTMWVALGYIDNTDKIKANVLTDTELGGISDTDGRVVGGLSGTPTSEIVMEIDYANGELRTSAPNGWDWSSVDVYTNSVDFDGQGFSSIGAIQTVYANWTAGDEVVWDTVTIEQIPEPASLGLVALLGGGLLFVRRFFRM